jgi:hypothetical protein
VLLGDIDGALQVNMIKMVNVVVKVVDVPGEKLLKM